MATNIFGILGIGASGLLSSQIAMDVTGDNIANANTEGYSRKRLLQSGGYRKDPAFGSMGMGVVTESVKRARDEFIDKRLSELHSEMGYYQELDLSMSKIEDIFLEPSDTGLNTLMNEFWNAWQDLSNNPEDYASREVVKSSAEALINKFHAVVDKLRNYQDTLNEKIEKAITEVNNYTKEIFQLNREIAEMEIKDGQVANDARDRRDEVIKKLANLIDIDYFEDERGAYNVTIRGNLVVSLSDYFEIAPSSSLSERYDGTTKRSVGIEMAKTHKPLIPETGLLKAYMDVRDEIVEDVLSQIDELANSIKDSVNELHYTGYTLDGQTGVYFFDPNSKGASDISLASNIINDVKNIAAASGATAMKATDTITAPAAPGTYGTPISLDNLNVSNFVNGTVVVKDTVVNKTLEEGIDYIVDYSRGTITLLQPSLVPAGRQLTVEFEYRVSDYKGVGDGSNALAIANLRETKRMGKDVLGNYNKTFDDYYNSFIGTLGAKRNEYKTSFESVEFITNQYKLQQDQIAGVSLDEEMINLVKFQHSYQASARVITTVEKMLDTLINM